MTHWKISADTGGTFTDCLLEGADESLKRGKVLSSGRLRTQVQKILSDNVLRVEPFPFPGARLPVGGTVWIAGRKAGKLVSAKGFDLTIEAMPERLRDGDILEIDSGLEAPVLAMRLLLPEADLHPEDEMSVRIGTTKGTNALLEGKGAPTALFLTAGFEDLLLIRDQRRPDLFSREIRRAPPLYQDVYGVTGRLDTEGKELEALDEGQLRQFAEMAMKESCTVAAVSFLNSWTSGRHESRAGEILRACGFQTIQLSSEVRPLIKYLDRTETTLVEATLSPVMDAYLDRVEAALQGKALLVMTSAGGLVSRNRFHSVDSLVSGPAGGVLGAVAAGRQAGMDRIITLDMGGTSTDVSRWNQGQELRQQIQVGEARILTPAMPIETVAAGGGSICSFDGERLRVGPESAGADPGPASYGAGGPLTLTDIHLLLGRLDPGGFSIPIRVDLARAALAEVADQAGESDWRALAEGFLTIATERMEQAIRQVSLREGEDPAKYGLVAFGGAGGLHACQVAERLGVSAILFPADAGILSARGIHYAPLEAVVEQQLLIPLAVGKDALAAAFEELSRTARQQLAGDGVMEGRTDPPECTVFIRLRGQESSMPVKWKPAMDLEGAYRERFVTIFGYYPEGTELDLVKARLRLLEHMEAPVRENFPQEDALCQPVLERDGFYGGRKRKIPVFDRSSLKPGDSLSGPAVIRDPFSTCFIEEGWTGLSGDAGSIRVRRKDGARNRRTSEQLENVERTLVLNRLESLVSEMGDQLQRTALSTNIRERLDFSCALLDREGRLLVNAPHIPVHLGAMGLCVRECASGGDLRPGDVIITNHPAFGGSHLPDVTLICGLFDDTGSLMGYLANRAHHAEWGGKYPGSMPADGKHLEEEGVIVHPQWLIRNGKDNFKDIEQLLRTSLWPSRAVAENRSDLEAQLASLRRGSLLFKSILNEYAPSVVSQYFGDLYRAGASALREILDSGVNLTGEAFAALDDGHLIRVKISRSGADLVIDFSGTSGLHPGNLNATPAIVRSAILYVLRLLVNRPMPLNEGLLEHVRVHLPPCFLNPEFPENPRDCPAVVGGNVETSQRLVDALVTAFDLLACGQGTMNNLLFGNARFGYYETIGGGAGAGEGFHGASGTHVHMTNTAITDPEILEHRFPVQCREFSIRKGSGGKGCFPGGDGLCREIRFLESVSVSILSQNRLQGAKGAHGGGPGLPGGQYKVGENGRLEPLGGLIQVALASGEGIRIETPGGGAWGKAGEGSA